MPGLSAQKQTLKILAVTAAVVFISYFSFWPKGAHVDVAKLNPADAIEVHPGDARRTIYIFEQPHCEFCAKLAPELDKLSGVRVLVFIVAPHGGDSPALARNAWCAKRGAERAAAWRSVLLDRPTTDAQCDVSAVGRNLAIAKAAGMSGTPSIVFANGDVHTGFLTAAQIEERVNDADPGSHRSSLFGLL